MTIAVMLAAALTAGGVPEAHVTTEGAATTNAQLRYAAQELTNWVAKISGAQLPVDDLAAKLPTTVYLGTPRSSAAVAAFAAKHADDFAKIGDTDGFVIAEEGGFLGFGEKRIYIAGSKTKGVLNGVYRFFEKNTDIIWAREMQCENGFGTIYGRNPDVRNAVEHFVDVPVCPEARFWSGPMRWQARLLGKRFPQSPLPASWEKNLTISPACDPTKEKFGDVELMRQEFHFNLIDRYKVTDPDVFPLWEGKRQFHLAKQLCFMNPKTAKLFAEVCNEIVGRMPHTVQSFAITPSDNWQLCQCDFCKAPIKLPDGRVLKEGDYGYRSTQFTIFANRLTDLIQARYPWAPPVQVMCYVFTAEAPQVKCKGGAWLYAPYVKNHKKPVYDKDVNPGWGATAIKFKEAGMPFRALYEYYLCSTTPRFYNAVCEVAQKDFQFYLPDLKQIYLDAGGDDKDDAQGSSERYDVSGIEYWTMMRLMWNPFVDVTETRHEYCRRAFREAADIMIGYFDRLAKNYNDDPIGCYWNDVPTEGAKHYIVEKGLAGWLRETLAAAEAKAVHPGSKELIRRHRAVMEKYVALAEKMPKKVTLVVPQILEKPDFSSDAYWAKAAKMEPITKWGKGDEVLGDACATVKLAHDRQNIYVLATCHSADYRKRLEAALKAPPPKPTDQFLWDTPFEFYLDGDLAAKGGYHFFAARFNGQKYTGCSSAKDPKNPPWDVKYQLTDDGCQILMTYPLKSIGVEISMGNRIGCQFIGPGCAWNGGQWHSPASFQTLFLEMK